MIRLRASRLEQVVQATSKALQFTSLEEFSTGVLSVARELVPCDIASYNEIKPGASAVVIADPPASLDVSQTPLFARLAIQNPLVAYFVATGDGRALRFSDFISTRQLHDLEIYDALYSRVNTEHQVAFVLPAPPGEVIGVSLSRQRKDFSSEEVAMLDLLRGPLRASYLGLVQRMQLTRLLSALDGEDEHVTRAALLLDRDGLIVKVTSAAEELLQSRAGEPAPDCMRTWLREYLDPDRSNRAMDSLGARVSFEQKGLALTFRYMNPGAGEPYAFTLTVFQRYPSHMGMRALGISTRQSEVLRELIDGRSNIEIAQRLAISRRTVEKHLENIYSQLRVSSRTQAIHKVQSMIAAGEQVKAGG